ncbi:NAD(P)H:quinone oxidoreductase [Sphingobium sp. TKS]|nr:MULTISPECIES: NAD(P)H:quinone oxidoreductase [Sphingomonadaceae]AMK25298.1 flavoprotein WrbA [Sphingobium sp. TKS]NML87954.1 NAD(P)H:quinone oxidoreductase [Sphingobium sp. TB-6]
MTHTKILIVFYSRAGSTEALALAVAAGASAAGAEVRIRRAREIVAPEIMQAVPGWTEQAERMNANYESPSLNDAEWADAIIFGTPTRFGSVASEVKAYIDGLGGLWAKGRLDGKAGSVFGATSSTHGGNESTLLSLYNPLAHLGMVIVPLGYGDPVMFAAGTPYGATHASMGDSILPDEAHLAVARYQGRRVTEVARALRCSPLSAVESVSTN